MPLRISSLIVATMLLGACAEEAMPPQPTPPSDRNFTATVNGQPVVGGTQRYECVINSSNDRAKPQFLLTFTDDLGHTIQIGIDRGDDRAGNREILFAMATTSDRAYGNVQEPSAALTWVEETANGALVSGRFDAKFDVVNVRPGVTDKTPLTISNALFEQVECLDLNKMRQSREK